MGEYKWHIKLFNDAIYQKRSRQFVIWHNSLRVTASSLLRVVLIRESLAHAIPRQKFLTAAAPTAGRGTPGKQRVPLRRRGTPLRKRLPANREMVEISPIIIPRSLAWRAAFGKYARSHVRSGRRARRRTTGRPCGKEQSGKSLKRASPVVRLIACCERPDVRNNTVYIFAFLLSRFVFLTHSLGYTFCYLFRGSARFHESAVSSPKIILLRVRRWEYAYLVTSFFRFRNLSSDYRFVIRLLITLFLSIEIYCYRFVIRLSITLFLLMIIHIYIYWLLLRYNQYLIVKRA